METSLFLNFKSNLSLKVEQSFQMHVSHKTQALADQ